jgi:hypothetical protein
MPETFRQLLLKGGKSQLLSFTLIFQKWSVSLPMEINEQREKPLGGVPLSIRSTLLRKLKFSTSRMEINHLYLRMLTFTLVIDFVLKLEIDLQ